MAWITALSGWLPQADGALTSELSTLSSDMFSPCEASLVIGGVASVATSNPFPFLLSSLSCLPEVSAAAPTVTNPVADQVVGQNSPLDLTLYSDVIFTDTDGDFLNVTVSGAGGGALPGWMTAMTVVGANPSFLGSYDTLGSAYDVAVVGSVAYVADGTSGLQIIDVTTPSSPSFLGSYDTPDHAFGVAVVG